jgi:two-component system, response regulator YesN
MRVVIADDEYLARASLKSMLAELEVAFDFVGEAATGREMAALVSQYLPEVVFVDIQMPELNGLEGIKLGKTASPRTHWFILTGFPEFDYAQEAIRLGVSGYLLKPVAPEELRKVLGDFIEQDRKLKALQNKQFERELMALGYGLTALEFEDAESLIRNAHFIGAVFYLDSYLPEKTKAERQVKFRRAIQELIDQSSDNNNRIALIILPSGELAAVGAWEPGPNYQSERRIRKYFQALDLKARNASDKDLVITVLASPECPTYLTFQEQLERLQKLAPLRVVSGLGKRLDSSLLQQQAEKPRWLELSQGVMEVSRCYHERNYLNYMNAVQQLESHLSKTDLTDNSLRLRLVDFFDRAIHCPLNAGESNKIWIGALQQLGEGLLREMSKDEIQSGDLSEQVIAFVDQNFMRDIGIGQIAERLNITPNYLSALFHKKTGVNFMSYLKKVRMLKAKELLADPNLQIQKVAEQVGYYSARHFARLFAEQFGCLPSEYRDRFKSR